MKKLKLWLFIACMFAALPVCRAQVELVYAEMEFPLSFEERIQEYRFNPLQRFQTQIEGRIIELTCDPLVDLYLDEGQIAAYRPCLANWRTMKLRTREVLNFNLANVKWPDGRKLSFKDAMFSLQYRKTNRLSWGGNQNLNIEKRSDRSFDAYLVDAPRKAPKPGEFYFPLVNYGVFHKSRSPARARVNKQKQNEVGYGRYFISEIEENRYIAMKRRREHPYYSRLKMPQGYQAIDKIRMYAFPRARIQRNEEFTSGRLQLITNATQQDVDWIINGYPEAQISRYYDSSFTGFAFNCRHPLLKPAPVRRALNYAFRKKLAMDRALRGQGVLSSGPLPANSTYYNIEIPPYSDDLKKALAVLKLYRSWGLDILEQNKKLVVASAPTVGPCQEIQAGDIIIKVENKAVKTLPDLVTVFSEQGNEVFRINAQRGKRVKTLRVDPSKAVDVKEWNELQVTDKITGFPKLVLIANNPEGKNALVKEICGALKEDLQKIGIVITIDYLEPRNFYPRLQKGDFDLAFRTLKVTGTPSLYRMFYKQSEAEKTKNANYGGYDNAIINEIAESTKTITDTDVLIETWKKAHKVMHDDPPYIYLWSRRHILVYTDRLKVIKPNPEYEVPYGYKKIDGLINIFSEVHLWGLKE